MYQCLIIRMEIKFLAWLTIAWLGSNRFCKGVVTFHPLCDVLTGTGKSKRPKTFIPNSHLAQLWRGDSILRGYSDGFYTSVQKGGGLLWAKSYLKSQSSPWEVLTLGAGTGVFWASTYPKSLSSPWGLEASGGGGVFWVSSDPWSAKIFNSRECGQEYPILYDFDNIFPH